MKIEQYPEQEPLSSLGQAYAKEVMDRGHGVTGLEVDLGDDPYRSLTVFVSPKPSGHVLVFFHGGGWTSGYKEWMYFMAPALTAQGITFVSSGYRLAPQYQFPIGFEDCADSLAWVSRNIQAYGGDANRVFVGGHSAGAHYAALLSVTRAWRSKRDMGQRAISGCLPVSGTYRFGEGSGLSMRPRFLGPIDRVGVEVAAAPLERIDASVCPPFLVTWGENDFPHLVRQSEEMAQALRGRSVPVATLVLPGCDHFQASLACGEVDGAWVPAAVSWIRQQGGSHPNNSGEKR